MPDNNAGGKAASPRKHMADSFYEYASKGISSSIVESKAESLPALSLYMFVTSLMTLGGRLRRVGRIELGIAEFVSWQRPAMTLSVLCLYSTLCYHPQWLVLLPLFLLVTTVLVPNYAAKFKIKSLEDAEFVQLNGGAAQDEDEEKQTRNLLEAVRQGQHTLTHIVETLDKLDQFRDGPAKFADPQPSCLMLVACTGALVSSAVALTFVSVPAVFSTAGWLAVLAKHPRVKRLKKRLEKVKFQSSLDIDETIASVKALSRRLVLVDDAPLERIVEMFELQPQGLTPRQWSSLKAVYSSSMYTLDTQYRIERQLAPSVASMDDVLPPEGWYFSTSDQWQPDTDAASWTHERMVPHVTVDGQWAIDADADSLNGVWRRRRWTRRCFYTF